MHQSSCQRVGDTPTENEVNGWQIIRKLYEGKYLSSGTIDILLSSWREATSRQYHICLLKWCTYCWERNINPFSPCLSEDLSLLTLLFSTGIGYSALNTARSALSTFIVCDNLPNGRHPLVRRFLQGAFNRRPFLPRNNVTWDVSIVLRYLQQLWPISNLSLKDLTIKYVMLLALTTGQRAQSIHFN